MKNAFEELKKYSTLVADTADFEILDELRPADATTNPSLILKTVLHSQYATWFMQQKKRVLQTKEPLLELLVAFGYEISKRVQRVSTEVDARLSFDTEATIAQARTLINLYKSVGVDKDKILIKIASTWEGIAAAEILEKEGIHCNLTLLFSTLQARACALSKVQLISPFVGRVSDWHIEKKLLQTEDMGNPSVDPGIKLVSNIYALYKSNSIATEIMAASFRNTQQIKALAGCDLLTIAPTLLLALQKDNAPLQRALQQPSAATPHNLTPLQRHEFYIELCNDAMAYEKLGEGIRLFAKDTVTLEKILFS